MAISLGDNVKITAGLPVDVRYQNGSSGPYTGVTHANTVVTTGFRYTGLTLNISGTEYWYENGIEDIDLVEKTSGGGSGLLNWSGSTSNAIGTYMSVSGICAQPNLTFDGSVLNVSGKTATDTLQVKTGAASGCVLTSDASGNATWTTPSGGATDLGYITSASTGTVTSSTGTDATLPAATTLKAGVMACADKVKLDGIEAGATADQTSIVGISGTKAQFNTALTDGTFLYVGDITQYTDAMAVSAVAAADDYLLNTTDTFTGTLSLVGDLDVTGDGSFGGDVGIGTSSPGGKLDIAITGRNLQFDFPGSTGHRILAEGTAGGSLQLQFNTNNSATSVFAIDEQSGTDSEVVDRRFIITKGGNVGIGTTSPEAKLDLQAASGGEHLLRFSHSVSPTAAGIVMGLSADETVFEIKREFSDVVYDVMAIDRTTGNVGIGTTTPSEVLEVEKSQDAQTAIRVDNRNTGTSALSALALISYENNLQVISYGDNHSSFPSLSRLFTSASNTKISVDTGTVGDGIYIDNGNVGIGTTNPTAGYKLDVNGNEIVQGDLDVTGDGYFSGGVGIGTTSPGGKLDIAITGRNLQFDFPGSTGHRILAEGTAGGSLQLQFNTNNSANSVFAIDEQSGTDSEVVDRRFIITKGGNVGIGIDLPVPKLHLKYTSGSYSTDSSSGFINEATTGRGTQRIRSITDNPVDFLFDVNGAARWGLSTRGSSEDYKLNLYGQTANPHYGGVAGPYVTVLQTGEVGIGTSPISKLHIFDADPVLTLESSTIYSGPPQVSVNSLLKYNSTENTTNFGKIVFAKNNNVDADTGGYTAFYKKPAGATATEAMRIDPDGNVGIGTTTPSASAKLDVVGETKTTTLQATTCLSSPVVCATTAFRTTGTGLRYCGGTGCGTAVDWIATSDIRIKKNITPITSALSKVDALCGICYNLCEDNTPDMGLIAQEVELVEPRLVSKNEPSEDDREKYNIIDEKYGLKYDKFAGLFVEAIKELKQQNQCLQIQIDSLRKEIRK